MKKLFLGFLLLGLLSCSEEKVKMPPGLLPPGQLTSILADIHVLESRVDALHLQPDTAQVIFRQHKQQILKKHGVSSKKFEKTYDFYLQHVMQLDKIYEALVDTLSVREINLAKKNPNGPQPQPAPNPEELK